MQSFIISNLSNDQKKGKKFKKIVFNEPASPEAQRRIIPSLRLKDDKTEENTFEILQHSDINIYNS